MNNDQVIPLTGLWENDMVGGGTRRKSDVRLDSRHRQSDGPGPSDSHSGRIIMGGRGDRVGDSIDFPADVSPTLSALSMIESIYSRCFWPLGWTHPAKAGR